MVCLCRWVSYWNESEVYRGEDKLSIVVRLVLRRVHTVMELSIVMNSP
jgi:hypothetical protein